MAFLADTDTCRVRSALVPLFGGAVSKWQMRAEPLASSLGACSLVVERHARRLAAPRSPVWTGGFHDWTQDWPTPSARRQNSGIKWTSPFPAPGWCPCRSRRVPEGIGCADV